MSPNHSKPLSLLWFFFKTEAVRLSILAFLMIIFGLVPCVDTILLKNLVDQATSVHDRDFAGFASKMTIWIFIYPIWWESLNVLWRIYDYLYLKALPNIKATITDYFFKHTQYHSHNFFQYHLAGYITNRIMEASRSGELVFAMINERILRRFVSITGSVATMYYINPIFAAVFCIWMVFFGGLSVILSGRISDYSKKYAKSKARVAGKIVDVISNITAVRIFSRHRFESKYLRQYLNTVVDTDRAMQWFMFKIRYVLGFSTSCMIAAMLYYLVDLRSHDVVTVGDFVAIVGLCTALCDEIWDIVQELGDSFEEYGAFAQSVSLLRPHDIVDAPHAQKLFVPDGRIEFKKVVFRYKEDVNLFQDKSVIIPAGQKVGLVGMSGSGKSTFVGLISRLYDIHEGQILIDNVDIKTVTQESLHDNISFIPQEPILFHRTIKENIAYGKLGATDEEIYEAAKKAHVHDVIMALPEGYDTLCGERGNNLSGGQRQRVVIARAALKNSKILILDEATSALDTLTEKLIQDSLNNIMQDKTVLVIAHRLSTLLNMDRILVFNQGTIAEDGTHQELLKLGTLYNKLWNSQIEGFIV